MHAAVVARHALSSELAKSVGRGELAVFFQPIIGIGKRESTASRRWYGGSTRLRGLLAPDDFIPLAEESGTILTLGRWMLLEKACRQVAAWSATGRYRATAC